jgi:class 3 adenylate cyclase
MIVVFYIYDCFVERRNARLIDNAARSNAVVTSLFPEKLREQVLDYKKQNTATGSSWGVTTTRSQMKNLLENNDFESMAKISTGEKPLADLYLETTVLFADIVGFTAWSSVREPSQVFTLLETVYSTFDELAKTRRVFKVETVGDCYVAVTGFPNYQKDHTIRMCRFAIDCRRVFRRVVNALEVHLGPDTGELGIRIGIHSGQVTAGVLRGDRSRLQLFGDTMNTAARMESTGESGKIQMSRDAAEKVIQAGKESWLKQREAAVMMKGKGVMGTFWLSAHHSRDEVNHSSIAGDSITEHNDVVDQVTGPVDDRSLRLVNWHVETMVGMLRQIVARRNVAHAELRASNAGKHLDTSEFQLSLDRTFLEEVKEIIELPGFDAKKFKDEQSPETVSIDGKVVEQLRDFVTCVATLYRDNSFHNFEHASHVTMSVVKLLSRIVAPSETDLDASTLSGPRRQLASSLHDHTYGITSDPLTQFACVFSGGSCGCPQCLSG